MKRLDVFDKIEVIYTQGKKARSKERVMEHEVSDAEGIKTGVQYKERMFTSNTPTHPWEYVIEED